jgi:tryptophan-rich sensory protein
MLRLIIFLLINFGALGIGGLLLGNPQTNEWYQALNKAPWTPPGWLFGFAWSTIMLCFSVFMWKVSGEYSFKEMPVVYVMFVIQFVLNVMWNPIFFRWHMMGASMLVILSLTILIAWFTYWGFKNMGLLGVWMLPYLVWLLIACSLNGYAFVKN